MERHRLKTVMILILALLNLFLAVHLARLLSMEAAADRLADQQLAALFEAGGVTLAHGAVSRRTLPAGCTLERDEALGDSLAAFFLPADAADRAVQRMEDGTRVWTGGGVIVRLTGGGAFSVTGLEGVGLERCRKFCRQFGYQLPQEEPEETCHVNALYNGLDVCNCQASFAFQGEAWRSASGILLPRRTVPFSRDVSLLSSTAALSAFLAWRQENRPDTSTVTSLEQGYVLRGGEDAALEPVWRVVTDTAVYGVNGVDGSVFLV